MFPNRTVAAVGMLFAAALLAQPGPAIAQANVDEAMGVLPSPPPSPGPGPGVVIVNGQKMTFEEAQKIGIDPSDAEAKGIIIVNNKPVPLSEAAARGIIIVNNRPGGEGMEYPPDDQLPTPGAEAASPAAAQGMVLPGAAEGFNPQPEPPGKGMVAPGAAQGMVLPGAAEGFNPQPEPPGITHDIAPAPQAPQGLQGAPAMKKIKALQ